MKNTIKRIVYAVCAVMIMALFIPESVEAAALPITEENFDYTWYLKQHPDLANQVNPDDHATIWAFYLNTGAPAGWRGRVSRAAYVTPNNFNVTAFLKDNPDVLAVIGSDPQAVYSWYVNTGAAAGRKVSVTDDASDAVMKIYDVADSIVKPGMSDRDKIKSVHDWIINNTSYDLTFSGKGCHSEIGVMKNHRAVCEGYADAFNVFMDVIGIESEKISGTATNSANSTGGHAWNRVRLNGNWKYIDVTWDDPVTNFGDVCRYNYFLIDEAQMNANHKPTSTISY